MTLLALWVVLSPLTAMAVGRAARTLNHRVTP